MDRLLELTELLEKQGTILEGQRAQQYAGLPYEESTMDSASLEIEKIARQILEEFPPEKLPSSLFFALITMAHQSEYTKMENEIYRLRNEAVKVKIGGETVNLSNWRRFNAQHLLDAEKRKRAFDGLMEKASALTPVLDERFALSRKLFATYNLDPLKTYIVEERVSLLKLKELVEGLALKARPLFLELGDRYAREILGKPLEYYDDMYVFRSFIYQPVDPHFKFDFQEKLLPIYRSLGFDTERILIDGQARPGKHASPVCFAVQVPSDVHVLYQPTSPVSDYMSFSHEMGHALHFSHIDQNRPFWDRYLIANGIAEIFSTLFEGLSITPSFLVEEIDVQKEVALELYRRNQFMQLYFLVFYGVNSMLKIKFWEERLTMEQADKIYAEYAQKYMGLPLPGIYWQTHHVASMFDMYTPSYLLAQIRMEEMVLKLEEQFGKEWWKNSGSGAYIKGHITPGGAIDLESFSSLNDEPFWRKTVTPPEAL
jgi:oligoendopeptidase F